MSIPHRKLLPRFLAVAVVLALLVLMMEGHVPGADWIQNSQQWFISHPYVGPVVYFWAFVFATIFFVPSWLLTVGAGLIFGWVNGLFLSAGASVVAASISFLISRHLSNGWIRQRLLQNRYFHSIDRAIRERGGLIIGLLRLSPMPFSLGNWIYGLTSVPFTSYFFSTLLGILPATVLFAYLGQASGPLLLSGAHRTHSLWEWVSLGVSIVVAIGVTVYVSRKVQHYLNECPVTDRGDSFWD